MKNKMGIQISSPYKGSGQITREQFLFHEMRTTARLIDDGLERDAIVEKIVSENLFQYPTEKSLLDIARGCLRRLDAMEDEALISAIASQPSETAKQICLYAMMRRYRLVWDFMIIVIGAKYQSMDFSFGRIDLNTFFMRLQEQDDTVASWSDSTVRKLKQILTRILVENDYLDNTRSDHLNTVMLSPLLEKAIRNNGMTEALPAFNCLS